MIAVTTFSKTGYEKYGRRFLESAIEYWPTKIIAYHEGAQPDLTHEKIEYRSLFNIKNLVAFLQYIQNIPRAHGKTDDGYDYNFDCWKFCRKSFAQLEVLASYQGRVFWLDADLEMTKYAEPQFLNDLFYERPLTYLGRTGWYTETGFVGFDTEHPAFPPFLANYSRCYQRGVIFTLPRWHDCEAFDWARRESNITGHNLMPHYVNGKTNIDVLPQSQLTNYMKHHKGPSKNA